MAGLKSATTGQNATSPFVMGRKDFLFANVPKGAEAGAIIYSLVETAKENGLDPCRYLTWLMREASNLNLSATYQVTRLLLVNAPEECRVKKGV
jgi:transposase